MRDHYRQIADTAQAKLAVLQQKLMAKNSVTGTSGQHLSKTFRDYIQETRLIDEQERNNERKHADAVAVTKHSTTTIPATPAAPTPIVSAPATTMAQQAAMTPLAPIASQNNQEVDQILDQLDQLGEDKVAKKNLILALPTELSDLVKVALKQQKEEKDRKAREADAELEDLL